MDKMKFDRLRRKWGVKYKAKGMMKIKESRRRKRKLRKQNIKKV